MSDTGNEADKASAAGNAMRRIAAAPISWGVCEAPDWGVQLEPQRVLSEMQTLGVTASELGPDGWMGSTSEQIRNLADNYGIDVIAGFVCAMLHVPEQMDAAMVEIERQAIRLSELDADVLVLSAIDLGDGYDRTRSQTVNWYLMSEGIERARDIAGQRGLEVALHPHIGTLVETAEDIHHVLAFTDVNLCLDTGHIAACSGDPLTIVRDFADRVRHVHLKDYDAELATRVARGEMAYSDAVTQGIWTSLGSGDCNIVEVVRTLEEFGYSGWYVVEQDVRLDSHDDRLAGLVRQNLEYARSLLTDNETRLEEAS